jgi:hypothetical protein
MKSFLLPLEPQELDDFLVEIRESSPFNDINASAFFHLVKPTEENLRKYKLRCPKSKIFLTLAYLTLFPLILLQSLSSIVISFYSLLEFKSEKDLPSGKYKFLFLSHFTYAQDPKKEDVFFGKNLDFNESCAFFLNHTRLLSPQIKRKFYHVGKRKVAVNTKALSLFSMVELQVAQLQISWWLFIKSLRGESLDVTKRRLLIKAAFFQHRRSTIANLVLRTRLRDTMIRVKPKFLVLTIEGHAHEKIVLDMSKKSFEDTKVIGYQHAPIVPGQLNLFRTVSNFSADDYFFTSGSVSKKLALNHGLRCKVETLGSPKARLFEYQKKSTSIIQVLVAPEGTRESLSQFIKLINELAPSLPNISFVLRSHPALGNLAYKMAKEKLFPRNGVSLSTASLSEDLRRSHLILFRSSAIGIEGLSFGVLPIHINQEGDDSLNPLISSEFETVGFRSVSEIIKFIKAFDLRLTQDETFQKNCYRLFDGYFGKLQSINTLVH